MKAAVLVKYGAAQTAFNIAEVAEPLVKPNEVKIKVECFGLNFADVMARKGMYADAPPLPAILGYEVVGTVVEQGNQVQQNYIGKRVVGFTRFGGYAQYAVTTDQAIVEVNTQDEAAKLLALATQYCTAWYASNIVTTVQKNDVVLQHAAAGGVGTALVQLCKLKGAKVIGLSGSDSKFDAMRANGCDAVFNYKKGDYTGFVKQEFGSIDISFNSVAGSTFKKDLRLLNFGGRLICYGAAERMGGKLGFLSTLGFVFKMGFIIPVKLLMKSNSLMGVNMLRIADHKPYILQTCLHEVYNLYTAKKIDPVIGAVYAVTDIGKAHHLFEQGQTNGKLVINW